MRLLLIFIILFSNFAFSQYENELKKKDSVFILFEKNDNQKIYMKLIDKETNVLKRVMYKFYFENGDKCHFSFYRQANYDNSGNEVLKTYEIKKSFLIKNKHKIITYEEINDKGFVNYIEFLRERKVYIIDLAEAKGRHFIARGVIFGFIGEE